MTKGTSRPGAAFILMTGRFVVVFEGAQVQVIEVGPLRLISAREVDVERKSLNDHGAFRSGRDAGSLDRAQK